MLKDRIQLGNEQVLGLRSGYTSRRAGLTTKGLQAGAGKVANEACHLNQVKPLNGHGVGTGADTEIKNT